MTTGNTTTDLSSQFTHLPKLVVFDLDYTLWPYYVDTHIDLPLSKESDGTIRDARKTKLKIYPEVVEVLKTLKGNNVLLAVASRTHDPPAAEEMLGHFDLNKYFDFKEIYPGEKTTHFKRIKENSKISYDNMLFFDDENRNIQAISSLGVASLLVEKEVNMETLLQGLNLFTQKHKA